MVRRLLVRCGLGTVLLATLGGTDVTAQGIGIAAHVGTLGLGASAGTMLGNRIGLRGSANFFPIKPTITTSDIEYTVSAPSPQFQVGADFYVAGALRVGGGLLISTPDLVATSDQSGSSGADIGGVTFLGSEVGTLTGAIVNKDVSPYLGLGLGKLGKKGLGFFLDLGVAFHGEPGVILDADGTAANNPLFQQALRDEEVEIEDAIKVFKVYPILSLGLSFGF